MRVWSLIPLTLALWGCGTSTRQSVFTDLQGAACKEEVDRTDPNETRFWDCPGPNGYSLRVRQVESGRQSVDLVAPTGKVMPLSIQDKVTRSMTSLGPKAEWRLDRDVPVGLLIRVEAREDVLNPEKITRTIWAAANVRPDAACITQTSTEESQGRNAADNAEKMPCLGDLKQ